MNKVFFDTESIGYHGPTVMIQYCINDGPANLHNIFESTVQSTLDLIESHLACEVYGFNLVHDWFHYTRTYNVLSELPKGSKPDPLDYYYAEKTALDRYCLRPRAACDLLIVGKKTKFQATMNQKKIVIRKIPTVLSELLVTTLTERVEIPSIYFAKSTKGYNWRIVRLLRNGQEATQEYLETEIDPDFVNLHLTFAPSAALKDIMKFIGKEDVTKYEDLLPLPKVTEYSWYPAAGDWIDVVDRHLWAWKTDKRRIEYARMDPIYTRDLYYYLDNPEAGDSDSELALLVGGAHWRGFQVDTERCKRRKKRISAFFAKALININSPRQVKNWLLEVADPYEKQALLNTKAETLKKIADEWGEDNPELARRCKYITRAKRAMMEITLMDRLMLAGRMHCVNKIIGTKSNRMSGGSENYIKSKSGSINPQGIPKGPGMRSLFPLANALLGEELDAGDFSGFEVSIADAVYGDPILHSELLSGKKMHALFGAEMYGLTYERIMETEKYGINDSLGLYQRAKRGFFASLYGAEAVKLSVAMWLTEEEAEAGLIRFFNKYVVIKQKRQRLKERFTSLVQREERGKIEWQQPDDYIESFLGYKRHFTLENNIIKSVFELAQDMPPEFKLLGSKIRVTRRDRTQTANGAAMSALFAIAFGLQGSIFRAAANHEMQSPGGELTKLLQYEIWNCGQPIGIHKWYVMPLNVHDEIECPTAKEIAHIVQAKVNETVASFKKYVPLIKMKYGKIKHWGEK